MFQLTRMMAVGGMVSGVFGGSDGGGLELAQSTILGGTGMTTIVGIADLKANLSSYVALANNGERVVITDRGREVAEIGPLSADREAMWALVTAGKARWNGRKPILGDPLPIDVDLAGAVLEDRR